MAKSKKPAKSAKPAKKPAKKVAAKSTAKAKPSKAKPTKKTVAKPVKKTAAAKPKKAASKAKKPAKPKKSGTQFVSLMAAGPAGPGGPGTIGAGGVAAPATPQITLPLANANVTAGTDLLVTMTTNQTGFRYILELLDLAPPSTPVNFNIAAPGSSPFNHTIPGANLHATRNYRLRVCVDPGDGLTPPNLDHAIPINT